MASIPARQLKPNQVATISYVTRDLGYGSEDDTVEAYWTEEIDCWGKRTIKPVDGSPVLYLFDDEIVEVE